MYEYIGFGTFKLIYAAAHDNNHRPIIPPTSNIVDNAPDWNVSKQCEPIPVEHFV